MSDGKKEYIFTWFIENYSYCWHQNGNRLMSPKFTHDGLDGTVWSLLLYPRGVYSEHKDWISFFLSRSGDDGPENFQLKFELSVLSTDTSVLRSTTQETSFKMRKAWGIGQFIPINEVFVRRKTDYLPQDCLSLRCKIWRGEGTNHSGAQITARTRIGIEKIYSLHVVEDFSTLKPNEKKTILNKSSSNKGITLSSSIYFIDGPCCDGKIFAEITPINTNQILSKCKIFLQDISGEKIKCGEVDNRFDGTGKGIKIFPLTLTREDILIRKSKYMPNDELSFEWQFTFPTGVECEKIERTTYGKICSAMNQINVKDKDNIMYERNLSDFFNALKIFYNKQHLVDVQIKTKTKSFPVHKFLLCARSSVFNAILTNNKTNGNDDFIQVDDIDDDILQQFLLFLYSDKVKFQWESAVKLYSVADKYEVEKLKILCSCFLVDNLKTSNAGELLLLADIHNDSNLKKVVENFILDHEEDVFGSDEWGNLMETYPLLVSRTMRLRYI